MPHLVFQLCELAYSFAALLTTFAALAKCSVHQLAIILCLLLMQDF